MNIKEFANVMQKYNEKDKRWSIICFISFIFIGIFGADKNDMVGRIICQSIMIIAFSMHYLKRYLSVVYYLDFDLGDTDNAYLYNIAKTQAFQLKKYFEFLRKRLIIWEVVIFVISSVMCICNKDYIGILFAVIMGLIPLIVCLFSEKQFKKKICSRNEYLIKIRHVVFRIITTLSEVLIAFFSIILGYFLVYATISNMLFGGFDENIVIYRSFVNGKSYGVMIFFLILAIIFWMYPIKKNAKVKRIILVSILIVSAIANIVIGNKVYTEIYEDKIIVSNHEKKKEYSLTEIKSFKVYEKEESFQIKVTFKDGCSEMLFGSESTYTEAFIEKYDCIYIFMEKMIPIYIENGAKGEIDMEDIENLRDYISGENKQSREAFENIVEMLS